jgi:hypothetical protein
MGLSNWSWNGVPEAAADDDAASSICSSAMPAAAGLLGEAGGEVILAEKIWIFFGRASGK